jgi:AraC-like DNA-binding protein
LGKYRQIQFGVEKVAVGDVPRHIHRDGYANVILSGSFTEASFAGRTRASPGMVLLHGPFDCHADVSGSAGGPTILRLPWRRICVEGAYRVGDADQLAGLTERDPLQAELVLARMLEPVASGPVGWPDQLARALGSEPEIVLRDWAEQRSLNPASLSRGFRDAYGVSPQRFRLEARTRLAWRRVVTESTSFTQIAHECSFADLAHMSRSLAAFTGAGPSAWRVADRSPGESVSRR